MYSPYLHKLGGFNSSTPLFILKSYGLFPFSWPTRYLSMTFLLFFFLTLRVMGELLKIDELTPIAIGTDQLYIWVSSHHKIVWAVNERTISIKKSLNGRCSLASFHLDFLRLVSYKFLLSVFIPKINFNIKLFHKIV